MGSALLITALMAPGVAVGVVALLGALTLLAFGMGMGGALEIGFMWVRVLAIPATILLISMLLDRFCCESAPPAAIRRVGSVLGLVVLFSLFPLPMLLEELFLRKASVGVGPLIVLKGLGQVVTAACVSAAILQLSWGVPALAFAWVARREQFVGSALLALRALRPILLLGLCAFAGQLLLSFIEFEVGPVAVVSRVGE